ncbi:PadR family transcriptional regulator [Clostridium sp. MB40-C1]|uniref:PadR family transcriptional regulator n=1 Tax=Clostridium sp. MB40-C1 TaxID=3070996 RepID=UPI0027E11C8E|nr:PadR family transcriptional regulator [Clostridium sp. MB40-C1]WMJ79848.1 PadR family transcriptional regulator [Clostridium sp. MB40-C1]
MDTQLKKGVLELCVLSVLKDKDCYGYELVTEISKSIEISDGTIYPILRRLTKEGYFNTYLKESTEGPPRKYYSLTEAGERKRIELTEEWYEFVKAVNRVIKENEEKIDNLILERGNN